MFTPNQFVKVPEAGMGVDARLTAFCRSSRDKKAAPATKSHESGMTQKQFVLNRRHCQTWHGKYLPSMVHESHSRYKRCSWCIIVRGINWWFRRRKRSFLSGLRKRVLMLLLSLCAFMAVP